MFKIKKNEKNKNDSLRTLETENSSQLRKFIFFTYSPLSQEFLPKKKCIIKSKNNETKKDTANLFKILGYWNKFEHNKFIEALYHYNCAWKRIGSYLKNRTYKQIRSHAQKFYLRLKSFKDEELGLDFTSFHVKNLKDIIKIIKEKESINQSYGTLLYIISERKSFGKNIHKEKLNKKFIKKKGNAKFKIYEYKNENTNNRINNEKSNNIIHINFEDFLIQTIEKNNQNQSLYCAEYDNLLSDDIKMDSDNAFTLNSDIRNDSIFFETILSKKNL